MAAGPPWHAVRTPDLAQERHRVRRRRQLRRSSGSAQLDETAILEPVDEAGDRDRRSLGERRQLF
jgi:hypothetical protein